MYAVWCFFIALIVFIWQNIHAWSYVYIQIVWDNHTVGKTSNQNWCSQDFARSKQLHKIQLYFEPMHLNFKKKRLIL